MTPDQNPSESSSSSGRACRLLGQDNVTHVVLKLFSARWFCTVAAMWVWAILATTDKLGAEFNGAMIALIIKSYFDRSRLQE